MVNLSRDMIHGLVRVRILRAASLAPVSGVEVSQELATAGHRVSPGTLYPLLHAMEKAGWVKSTGKTVRGKRRRYYRVTKKGRAQLEQALTALDQFLDGIVLADSTRATASDTHGRVDATATAGLLGSCELPGRG
ncbi:MAG: PadR family transcriptional regulator [Chloroflexota bacterium]|nr:PadR family transcriptional regulator [Chloroflexota bacterium]